MLKPVSTAAGQDQTDHRIGADEHHRNAYVVYQVEEEVQHAFLATCFRQVKVLQFIDEQCADVERAGYLFHLLQSIVDVTVPMSLVIILVTECIAYRVEELLAEATQGAISWTIELEPRDLGVYELTSLITLMSNRLRVKAQNGVKSGGLPNATQPHNTE